MCQQEKDVLIQSHQYRIDKRNGTEKAENLHNWKVKLVYQAAGSTAGFITSTLP